MREWNIMLKMNYNGLGRVLFFFLFFFFFTRPRFSRDFVIPIRKFFLSITSVALFIGLLGRKNTVTTDEG